MLRCICSTFTVVSQKRKREDDSDYEDMLGGYQEEDSKQGSDDSDDIVPWNRKIKVRKGKKRNS